MWFTDTQVQGIPAFAGLTTTQLAQAAADAALLYQQIEVVPGITDADLRSWAESSGIPPERYNVAAQAIQQAGKAVDIATGALNPVGPNVPVRLSEAIAPGGAVPAEHFTVSELRAAADRLKLEVPKSATKSALADAIAAAPRSSLR